MYTAVVLNVYKQKTPRMWGLVIILTKLKSFEIKFLIMNIKAGLKEDCSPLQE